MTTDHSVRVADARLRELFAAWDSNGIQACVWKSADRWQDGLEGKTDFDLLVQEDRLELAQQVMLELGWIPVQAERWRTFVGLSDYISLRNGVNHHVHLHARIVSGEKLTKSLRPPLTDMYLAEANQSHPPFIKPELEFVVFIVRMVVKINWIDRLGALKRLSAFSVYRNYLGEYRLLREATDREELRTLLQRPQLSNLPDQIILAAHNNLADIGWRQRWRLRRSVASWRDFDRPNIWFQKMDRLIAKKRWGVGKTFAFTSPTIAICGADGSGKTTLVDALEEHLARHLRVSRYYMGSNLQYSDPTRFLLVKACWFPYLAVRKCCKFIEWHNGQKLVETLYQKLDLVTLRRQKMRRLLTAERDSHEGKTVLFERYPLFHPYGDDLVPPLLDKVTVAPDIMVLLDVSESTALERRNEDPSDVIRAKVQAFREVASKLMADGAHVLTCAENDSVETRVTTISDALDKLLSERARIGTSNDHRIRRSPRFGENNTAAGTD